jgi:protoporphyrinogen oxidase
VAVIGGGMLGMTSALRLSQRGMAVTLYEASDRLGGLADAWRLGDVTWDRHYHVTLLSDLYLRQILRELQLESSMRWVETKTGFFTQGRLYSVSNAIEFLRFPALGFVGKLRLAWTLFYGSKLRNWKRLEDIPVADWLRRMSGQRTFESMWLPLLRAKLGDNYRQTSAAFIWATIARLYAARRTGLKKEMFGYVPGGYATVIARWREALEEAGVRICTDMPVRSVVRESTESSGASSIVVETRDGWQQRFTQALVTIPSPVVSHILPQLTDSERAAHGAIQYQGIVCASLLLRHSLSRFYVTNITDDAIPFTGVIEMTALVDKQELGGHALVYLPKYLPAHDPAWQWSDEEIRARFTTGLQRMHPTFDPQADVLAFRISRVPHVMALPTIGYSKKLPPMRTSIPGIAVMNAAQIVNGTLNVNETIRLAEQAIESLCHELSPSPC